MAKAIEIKEIRVTPVPERAAPAMRAAPVSWFDVQIVVRNVSDVDAFIVSNLSALRVDAARRTVQLEFGEPERPRARRVVSLPQPAVYTALAPGADSTLTYRLASPLTPSDPPPEGTEHRPSLHIPEDLDTIECIVSNGSTRPPRQLNLASLERAPDPSTWGTKTRRTVPIKS